jgi:SAM-dependent methyltransferase
MVREVSRCPACEAPAASATELFAYSTQSTPCHVVQCACGLVFKRQIATHDALSNHYDTDYQHFVPAAWSANAASAFTTKLERCRRQLPRARRVNPRFVDIGCGGGQLVEFAGRLGFRAEGVDPFLPGELQSATLRRGGPTELPAGVYDIATSIDVLEHVTEPLELLRGIRRALRDDGVALLSTPYGDSLARRFYRHQWVHLALDEHLTFWTRASLSSALRRAGFTGDIIFRIVGSPFPLGRTHTSVALGREAVAEAAPTPPIQSIGYRLGRRIQSHPAMAEAVRWVVDRTRIGDNLECIAHASA